MAAAHHTFNTFVNHGDNAKYGFLHASDIKTFVNPNDIALAVHGPSDSRVEVPHPDDHLSSEDSAANLPRRYQLYMMSRDGPFSVNFLGEKNVPKWNVSKVEEEAAAAAAVVVVVAAAAAAEVTIQPPPPIHSTAGSDKNFLKEITQPNGKALKGRMYGDPYLVPVDPTSPTQIAAAARAQGKQLKTQHLNPINMTTLTRDQYTVYQLPSWKKMELNEPVPRSQWQKTHTQTQ